MAEKPSSIWECNICGYTHDEATEGLNWKNLADDWECPVCGAAKSEFSPVIPAVAEASTPEGASSAATGYLAAWARSTDDRESHMADIHQMAATGASILEPMRSATATVSWNDILIKGAQLARLPLNADEAVSTKTVIGPGASPILYR